MRQTSRSLLWFAPILIFVMAVFFASIPWLKDLDDAVTLSITSAAGVFVMLWGGFVATRMERDLDEVQLAGQRFAEAKGAAGGILVTFLLLLPTPVVDWVADNLLLMTTGSGETPERDTVYFGMMFGMVLLIVMQALGTVVTNAIWNRRIGGKREMESDLDMNNRIRVLRAEKGWSQAELAERVHVSRNSINAVENGKFDPSLPLAFRIADAFELKIEDVFLREDRPGPA